MADPRENQDENKTHDQTKKPHDPNPNRPANHDTGRPQTPPLDAPKHPGR